jgi:Domain of unknown function (DUF4956)
MRKSTSIAGPLFLITLYYALAIAVFSAIAYGIGGIDEYLPIGGIDGLLDEPDTFEAVQASDLQARFTPHTMVRLALAMVGTAVLMVPVSWVYFITTRTKDISRSFAQTMMVLPIIVAGIAMIVQNSIALAFSLAGIVAAVRFRLTLGNPADALYVFSAIAIGLGAGISALGVSAVISIAFVYTHLLLWKVDYGDDLNTPFYSFLTGRGHDEGDE